MMHRNTRVFVLLLGVISLSGCSVFSRVENRVDSDLDTAMQLRAESEQRRQKGAVTRTPRARIAGEEVSVSPAARLPAIFDAQISYTTAGQSLAQVLESLSEQTGIPVWLTEYAALPQTAARSGSEVPGNDQPLYLQWQGPLRGLLDQLAMRSRLYWRYNRGRVEFFLYETRHFHVHLPVGAKQVSANVSGTGSVNREGGTNTLRASTGDIRVDTGDTTIDPYSAITRAITAILMEEDTEAEVVDPGSNDLGRGRRNNADQPPLGRVRTGEPGRGRVVVNPDLAMITITAPPPALDRIADYVDTVNRRFAKNVLIDIKIYDLALSDEVGAGFSMDLVYERLNRFGLEVVSSQSLATQSTAGTATLRMLDPNNRFEGSTAVAQALATLGKVSVSTSGQVVAINGQPAPLQIAEEISFLESSSVSQTANVGQVTTLTPGSRVVGLTANFLPLVLSDNRILLQYQLTLSSLLSLNQVSSGNATIQIPNIATQSVQQQAFLRDGQAIVLFGFEQNRSASDKRATLLGGSRLARENRSLRVIVMQVFGGGNDA